jgi:hypothetical protein
VQDYHALNTIMCKNHYPLLLINNLIHHLKGTHYFTKFNMCWGYNNVHVQEGNKWKATFYTNQGLFELLVMHPGLTNSPATLQTRMNKILRSYYGGSCLHVSWQYPDIYKLTR